MRNARRVTQLMIFPTIGLCIALALAPGRATLELHVWLLLVLGLALLAFTGAVHAAHPITPSPFAASLLPPHPPVANRPAALLHLERVATMAGSNAFDVHFRLRPTIKGLAAELLSARRGISLELDPERAHAALGDDAWEIVRPDRPQPDRRHGAGIDEGTLGRVVEALEGV